MAGIDEVTPHIALEGADETAESFRQIAAAAMEAFAKIEAAANQVGNAGQAVTKAADEGKASLQELGVVGAEAFAKIMDAAMSGNFTGVVTMMFGHMAGAITEATQKMFEFIHEQATLIETLAGLAAATGATLPQILAMREAFASVGISTNGFERSIGRLAITVSNEWTHIQQAVRTSADEQVSAMLHVQQAALNLEKAHHSMNEALTQSVSQAAHNALNIESSAIGLKKAGEALSDFLLQSRSNTLGIESAELALTRARMNLAKDQGHVVSPQDEKALKIAQDTLAVKEAELHLAEANNKKKKEGLEMEELQNRAKKSALDLQDAQNKQIEDSIKMSDRLKEARLHEQQAALAVREAQEKQHEGDLKNIPAIAKELEAVANKQKDWDSVINKTELSAQNLTKAIILAASSGGQKPDTLTVFNKMAELFPQITDKSLALSVVQHTMGAGFRAGQASAAQLYAVLARGPEALAKLTVGMEGFLKSMGADELGRSVKQLEHFNAASALIGSAFDAVKVKISAVLSVPVSEFFGRMRESLVSTDGTLNKLSTSFIKLVEGIATLAAGVGELIAKIAGPAWNAVVEIISHVMTIIGQTAQSVGKLASEITSLMGIKTDAFFGGFTAILIGAAVAARGLWSAIGLLLARLALIPLGIGLIVTAVGDLIKVWAWAKAQLPTWLGGGAENNKATFEVGQNIEKWGQAITREVLKLIPGITDSGLDKAGKQGGSSGDLARGFTGNSEEIKKLMEGPAHDQQAAAKDQQAAAHDQVTAAQQHKAAAEAQNRNAEFFKQKLAEQHPPDRTAGSGLETKGPAKLEEAAQRQETAADQQKQAAAGTGAAAEKLTGAAAVFDAMARGLAALLTAVGAPGSGKAGGGMIRGPGTPTSDTAGLFALSDGEYVVRSAAVSHYGPSLFEALNNLALGGFAGGGIVGARAPALAGASANGPSSVLNLTIDGNHFNGLKAPDHVAAKLKTYAVSRQTSAAQKMPSWMR